MAWTIIRSPTDSGSSSCSQPVNSATAERSLTPTQFRNLTYYVNWVFANPDRSTGLDFVLPIAEPSGVNSASAAEAKRRDSRMEGSSSQQASASGSKVGAPQMDAGRAKAIQQWVARTSPQSKEQKEEGEEEEDDEDESGSESD